MQELKLEELSVKQKLGMVTCGVCICDDRWEGYEENLAYTLKLIKEHSLGAVWVSPNERNLVNVIPAIKEAADYPILIMCDAESGLGEFKVGRHNHIGCTGSEEHAYTFGKVTALKARELGYNVICNPVLDMCKGFAIGGGNVRSYGYDKYKVAKLGAAEARGMHDGGVLTVGKHYPSASAIRAVDSHMGESVSDNTLEELLDYHLYPWMELIKEGLLDGIMTSHKKVRKIDPDFPTSLSKKMINVIREQGFDGFAITDCLEMMGVVAKFGKRDPKGMAIAAGNDLALPWDWTRPCYEVICDYYERGLITEERLNEAVRRVLEAQHKTLVKPKFDKITEEDKEVFDLINRDAVFAKVDDGLSPAISRDGKHFFAVMVENGTQIADSGKVTVDTFSTPWYNPIEIMERLQELFPNSAVAAVDQFPSPAQNMNIVQKAAEYEDVVFITFVEGKAYSGKERFTSRIISLIGVLEANERVAAVVHFGNPYPLEDLEGHVPRVLIGCLSGASVKYTIDVLAGKYPAKGVLTYDVKLK